MTGQALALATGTAARTATATLMPAMPAATLMPAMPAATLMPAMPSVSVVPARHQPRAAGAPGHARRRSAGCALRPGMTRTSPRRTEGERADG